MLRGKDVMLAQAALGLSRWSLVWCGVVLDLLLSRLRTTQGALHHLRLAKYTMAKLRSLLSSDSHLAERCLIQ